MLLKLSKQLKDNESWNVSVVKNISVCQFISSCYGFLSNLIFCNFGYNNSDQTFEIKETEIVKTPCSIL